MHFNNMLMTYLIEQRINRTQTKNMNHTNN